MMEAKGGRRPTMTYADALAYLDGRINYEVSGLPDAADLRLGRMHALLERLDGPHRKYHVVHVAGTKGKGSTATMIAALLRATGAKVGLHLSPHLERIEERMRVNGADATRSEFAALIADVAAAAAEFDRRRPSDEAELTFFELTTAAALLHFARSKVDWAVVEVGVGGRLDATNVVTPAVSVIAEIGLDHTKTLGDTVAAIAAEKAGIIKPGRPVVASCTHPDAITVVETIARRNGSALRRLGRDFTALFQARGFDGGRVSVETWKGFRRFDWKMLGAHQARNAALAWATVDTLADELGVPVPPEGALGNLRIPGRLEVIRREPFVVLLDVAHNEPSAAALADFLCSIVPPPKPHVLVFGATRDKNWPAMLDRLVPLFDVVVATEYRLSPRATPVQQVADRLAHYDARTVVTKDPVEAWAAAADLVGGGRGGLGVVAGSFFLAAEIRPILLGLTPNDRIE